MEKATPVIFRAERSGQFRGDITAVFPCEPSDVAGHFMSCYVHIGQHGGCSFDWYRGTRPATPSEYSALKTELESIGYRLKVYRRIQPFMRDELRKAAKESAS